MQQLGHDEVADVVVDRRAEEHDAVLEQAGVDVVRTLAAAGLLDDRGDQVVVHGRSVMCFPPFPRRPSRPTLGASAASGLSSVDIGTLDQEVERLGTDDIAGQRYDLPGSVELLGQLLRIAVIRLGQYCRSAAPTPRP